MAHQSDRGEGVLRQDTIAAAVTAAGQAAVGIVRISGPKARTIAEEICGGGLQPRVAQFRSFRDAEGKAVDSGLVLYFPAPASFTGEDVVELQCHGSPVIVDWLLELAHSHGARPARAGEFSLRAFLNEKLDLTQAEAIADLISSSSRAQAKAATRSLTGAFSERVAELQEMLTGLRVLCETWLDFPDEDIDHAAAEGLLQNWRELTAAMARVEQAAAAGQRLSDGLSVALAGLPNAGKSSLLNCLVGADAAIVTELPGTTRDTLREAIDIDGAALTLVDMAGLRATEDRIEEEGVRRAEAEIAKADHVLWVADIDRGLEAAAADARQSLSSEKAFSIVLNKIDSIEGKPNRFDDDCVVLAVSARTGAGVDLLRQYLRELVGINDGEAGAFSARRRHLEALSRSRQHIERAGPLLETGLELAAEELKLAQQELDELTGTHTSDDLLGEVFSSFCIGK